VELHAHATVFVAEDLFACRADDDRALDTVDLGLAAVVAATGTEGNVLADDRGLIAIDRAGAALQVVVAGVVRDLQDQETRIIGIVPVVFEVAAQVEDAARLQPTLIRWLPSGAGPAFGLVPDR
jgi:hypothetical protein